MQDLLETRKFFDEKAPRWIRDTEMRRKEIAALLTTHPIPIVAPVLDLGSGAGILLPFILERNLNSGLITECDISLEMLTLSKKSYPPSSQVAHIQGDAHHLPFHNTSYRTVICFSAYPHFHVPSQALSEVHRCLTPNGTLCILHLMGHAELNAMHLEAGEAVKEDVIPPAHILAGQLKQHGFAPYVVREQSNLYLILAKRN